MENMLTTTLRWHHLPLYAFSFLHFTFAFTRLYASLWNNALVQFGKNLEEEEEKEVEGEENEEEKTCCENETSKPQGDECSGTNGWGEKKINI